MKKLQVLGSGCPKCKKLAETMELAAKELSVPYEMEKVTEIDQILSFGVAMTPALVIDGRVALSGRVPSPDEAKILLG
ncbi:MAG: TM0996/MTH895 family glutaredoxin-like protein [Vicinamibacteria bacterium]|nr:TM0996/MTH895 family glutaredoxin-like protein [Vicinamibacteria bacterium]